MIRSKWKKINPWDAQRDRVAWFLIKKRGGRRRRRDYNGERRGGGQRNRFARAKERFGTRSVLARVVLKDRRKVEKRSCFRGGEEGGGGGGGGVLYLGWIPPTEQTNLNQDLRRSGIKLLEVSAINVEMTPFETNSLSNCVRWQILIQFQATLYHVRISPVICIYIISKFFYPGNRNFDNRLEIILSRFISGKLSFFVERALYVVWRMETQLTRLKLYLERISVVSKYNLLLLDRYIATQDDSRMILTNYYAIMMIK